MNVMTVEELARAVGGTLEGPAARVGPDVVVDARLATPGSVFVALAGEHADGHDFTGQAARNGAAAALVTRLTDAPIAHVVVPDTQTALGALAHLVVERARTDGLTVIALTGSSGKTSTKDLLAQILETAGPTVSPRGSFNNEIGVPLTACRVDSGTRFLVSEMGSRGIGHLRLLTAQVRPDIAMVLNVGSAHLGEFGSLENTALAKGELVEALGPQGWAVLNADDPRVSAMASRTRGRPAWFSRSGGHPDGEIVVASRDEHADSSERHGFTLIATVGGRTSEHPIQLRVVGEHQVANALAAAAAALAAGLAPDAVAAGLCAATNRSAWRMQMDRRADGAIVVNDAYNANPDSMAAALRTLAALGRDRRAEAPGARTVAVLGDMLELGPDAARLHEESGRLAAELGIDEVVAVGEFAPDICRGVRAGGGSARVLEGGEVAGSVSVGPDDVVLVKASRGLALDAVADELLGGATC